jgi:hypothetical protein
MAGCQPRKMPWGVNRSRIVQALERCDNRGSRQKIPIRITTVPTRKNTRPGWCALTLLGEEERAGFQAALVLLLAWMILTAVFSCR